MEKYNKTQLTKIARYILKNTKGIVEKKHSDFLIKHIFSNHPNFKEKVGCGIHHIEVRHNKYNQDNFYIVRIDNTSTDISYVKSLKYPNKYSRVMRACRSAVYGEIQKERDKIELPFVCPLTSEIITDKHLIHIDHYDLTFEELFNRWVSDKDIDYLYSLTLDSKKDNSLDTYFTDQEIINDFISYHNKNTHLRAVSANANLSVLRKLHINI